MLSNSAYSKDRLQGYLDEIDVCDDEIESYRGTFMQQCRGPRERTKEIILAAKDAGINSVAFRNALKAHRDERAQERRVAKLDMADRADYETIMEALGAYADTELGQAALERAQKDQEQNEEALNSLGRGN